MSGFNVAKVIKAKDHEAQFCFLTSFDINAAEARSTMPNLPGYCFLKKPLTPSELAEHLDRHTAETLAKD